MKLLKNLSTLNFQLSTLLFAVVLFAMPVKAQVTIGDNVAPHKFSILELITKNKDGGLRLPQLTTKERDGLNFASNPDAAQGLVIYNTTTNCLEFWNGKEWITMCSDILPPPPPIIVPETNFVSTTNGNIRLTTYINMMYDFQHQTLTAYLTSGTATAYQWQMSIDNTTWYDIVNAKNADYVVPADFMYKLGNLGLDKNNTDISSPDNTSIEIQFRCQITNGGVTNNPIPANFLSILFIRTNTAGYDIDPITGVRYLIINRGDINGIYGNTIKIALLNLGQSGTGSYINGVPQYIENDNLNDAGDLGDFYQWGRVADGHEHIVWSKDPSFRTNQINPMTGNGATSLPVLGTNVTMSNLDGNGQVLNTATGYGSFITNGGDWVTGTGISGRNDLWGNTYNRRFTGNNDTTISSPISLKDVPPIWTSKAQSNNPCPAGWRVPSRFELWDIYRGDGSTPPASVTSTPYVSTGDNQNTWRWRPDNSPSGTQAIGGAIISNSTGEKVFLPAAGYRDSRDGTLYYAGSDGIYWSSTCLNSANVYGMNFSGGVYAGTYGGYRADGFSVRCVSE